MRRSCVTVLSFLLSSVSFAQTSDPLCVLELDKMPESWRPVGEDQVALTSAAPWTAEEAKDAIYAIETGLKEIIDRYDERPQAISFNWEDSVGSLIELTYSSANAPEIDQAAREGAHKNLDVLIGTFSSRDDESATCDEYERILPLALYAHKFFGAEDARTKKAVAMSNAAFRDCGSSIDEAMAVDHKKMLSTNESKVDDVFDLVIWSLLFIEAQVIPGIELSDEARDFPAALWKYLETYPLPYASTYPEGAYDEEFVEVAYLATHIAYIPTGNHRFPLYIEDSPSLYRFHRDNFYPSMEMGELDLVAEMVDSLRQYGCTEENDLQVRDGTRFLLGIFHDGNDRWMAYREEDETDAEVDDYDAVHKAWTGILGVRVRNIEEPKPGTYGGIVRAWLPHPR